MSLKNLSRGDGQCLAWQPADNAAVFAACDGSTAQDWTLEPRDGFQRIVNAGASAARGKKMCLHSAAGDTGMGRVSVGACGEGDQTMRDWRADRGLDGQVVFGNRYRANTGRPAEVLAPRDDGAGVATQNLRGQPSSVWRTTASIAPPQRPMLGDKSVLLMVTHFNDSKPADSEIVRKAVFGDGDDYASLRRYLEVASRGKLTLHGQTLDSVNLGDRPATCDSGAIRTAARNAALARGVNPDKFNYLFVDLPKMSSCNWGGLAAMPGNWILSNASGHGYWMWSHEFGHNLGASHPGSLVDCPTPGGTVEVGGACRAGKIDDPSDTMGGGGRRLYPASYQLFAGWLGEADVPEINGDGTYRLAPLWGDAPGAKAYRIARADGSTLWLEFRQPLRGFDDWKSDDAFVNGVIVRTVAHRSNGLTNTLVDAMPGSAQGMKDAPLMPGNALHDTLSGKIVTVKSVGPDGAVVEVKNDGLLLPQAVVTGPQKAAAGAAVVLSGASSLGERLSYAWTAPAGIDAKPNGAELRFAAPALEQERDYAFDLTVTNANSYTSQATHVVKVKAQEIVPPPQAAISGPATVDGGATVTLSGAASTGKGLKYAWTGPAGVTLVQNGAAATFTAPKATDERRHAFKLVVTDAQGRKAEATHGVTVRASAGEGAAAWDPKKTYATPCYEVSHAGKTWVNGWWVLGDVPGTGGEWAAWREKGGANMHAVCNGK
ncbi:carbohydrate-binding protein [Burkholderia lata]|uniref:carbohydrate-binding protein n=1 Tax=Burkholderia lata (strain ATCC 17760 / DSM 23089 / LMG 22485 / NCIMB 9086 / R18194 / 383) TaxID=482957 RepID=UPI0014544364|nr:carbohydrate-binding protein [Burkholderia lata]VWD61012.1 carbohydrate-binding protein [Burkholderia lata]